MTIMEFPSSTSTAMNGADDSALTMVNTVEDPLALEGTPHAPRIEPAVDEENDDNDDLTIIELDDSTQGRNQQQAAALSWMEQQGPDMEERRRNVLLRELQRVQKASFIQFVLLCLIPTSLLFILVATVIGGDEDCGSEATMCVKEARTFLNAFTTRCICDAIDVSNGGS